MKNKIVNFIGDRKKILTRVMLVYLSFQIIVFLFTGPTMVKLYLDNVFYLQTVMLITSFLASVIGLLGFIKVNQVMCSLFLSYFGARTLYSIVKQFKSTQLILEKYAFDLVKYQLMSIYLAYFIKILIVLLGVLIVYSNEIEKRPALKQISETNSV